MKTFKLPCQACGAMLNVPDNVTFVTCTYCGQLNGIELTEGQISLKVQDQVRKTQDQVDVLSLGVQLPYWRKKLFELETAYLPVYQVYLGRKAREEELINMRIGGRKNLIVALILAPIGIAALVNYEKLKDVIPSFLYLRFPDIDYATFGIISDVCIGLPIALAVVVGFAGYCRYFVKDLIKPATANRLLGEYKCNAQRAEIEKLKARIDDAVKKVANLK